MSANLHFLRDLPPAREPNFWEHSPGLFLAWNEFGDPSGNPVFYYHGWPSSRLQARLAHHLAAERGLRVIAMDRPGLGRSTLVRERKLEDWPDLMARFADHLGIGKFGQIGVSGGGPYVLACAAMIPQRLTASAVLAGMVPLPLTGIGAKGLHPLYRALIPLRKAPAPFFTAGFRIASLAAKCRPDALPMSLLLRSLAAEDREIILRDPEIWPVLAKSFTEGVCGLSGGQGVMTDSEVYLRKPAIKPEEIRHPIRYWHGADDRNIPAALVRDLVSKMPAAALDVVDGLGHFSLAMLRAGSALDHIAETSTP
ncbi:alpha/beta hydrolase [Akkermansiaceae bacterium]|nr:alpha/beta hydrolase [Akkermansiaceae bacterium]